MFSALAIKVSQAALMDAKGIDRGILQIGCVPMPVPGHVALHATEARRATLTSLRKSVDFHLFVKKR